MISRMIIMFRVTICQNLSTSAGCVFVRHRWWCCAVAPQTSSFKVDLQFAAMFIMASWQVGLCLCLWFAWFWFALWLVSVPYAWHRAQVQVQRKRPQSLKRKRRFGGYLIKPINQHTQHTTNKEANPTPALTQPQRQPHRRWWA